jgi:hypothetical protein
MTIHWEESIDDALAFYRHYVETDAEVRRAIRIRQFLVPLWVWVILAFIAGQWNVGLIVAGLSPLWIALTPAWVRRTMIAKARKAYQQPENFSNLGAREMILDDEGFLLKTDTCETFYKWKMVSKVVHIPDYCFIDIAEQETLIIPTGQLKREETAELNRVLKTYVL